MIKKFWKSIQNIFGWVIFLLFFDVVADQRRNFSSLFRKNWLLKLQQSTACFKQLITFYHSPKLKSSIFSDRIADNEWAEILGICNFLCASEPLTLVLVAFVLALIVTLLYIQQKTIDFFREKSLMLLHNKIISRIWLKIQYSADSNGFEKILKAYGNLRPSQYSILLHKNGLQNIYIYKK